MVKNPYTVLEVSLSASDGEIRAAFRGLAKQYHPDRNPDNDGAEEKFKEISRAFDIIGDPQQRKKYDRGEIDAEGKPADPFARQWGGREGAAERARQQQRAAPFGARRSGPMPGGPMGPGGSGGPGGPGAGASFDDLGDIFADLFGGPRAHTQARGRDLRYRLDVDFLDALNGATKRVTMPDGRVLDLAIPGGLEAGQTLRLRGQGEAGESGGAPGDVYVETHIRPHNVFVREGADIHVEVAISLREAVLGAKITVPTIAGDVAVTVPKSANSGTMLRLRGRGMQAAGKGAGKGAGKKAAGQGDQYVKLKIILAEGGDTALEEFVEGWEAGKKFNPRKN